MIDSQDMTPKGWKIGATNTTPCYWNNNNNNNHYYYYYYQSLLAKEVEALSYQPSCYP